MRPQHTLQYISHWFCYDGFRKAASVAHTRTSQHLQRVSSLQCGTDEALQELDHIMNDVAHTPQARHQIPQSHDAPAPRKCRVKITETPLNRHICGDLEHLLPPSCPSSSPREVAASITMCSTNTARLFHGILYSQMSTDAANLIPVHSGTRKRKVD